MENQEFDRILRKKLENIRPEYDPTSWASLAARMDAGSPAHSEEELDQVVFEKLHAFAPAKGPEGWQRLAFRLEAARVRPQLIQVKVLEAALLLLSLFVLLDLLPTPSSRAVAESAVQPNGAEALRQTPRSGRVQEVPAASLPPVEASSPPARREVHPLAPGKAVALLPAFPVRPLPLPFARLAIQRPAPRQMEKAVPPLPALDQSSGPADEGLDWDPDFPRLRSHPLVVSMYGTFNYNRIFTPAGTEAPDGTPAVKRFDPGYGGGITLGTQWGRWEFGGGLEFNAYTYQPRQVVYLEGSLKEGLYGLGIKDVQINTLGIPLYVRYDVLRRKSWRLYAQGGFNLNVAFEANYYLADASQFFDDPKVAGRPPAEGIGTPRGTEQILNKELKEGWFEGGTFQDNAFMTGHVGIGAEYFPSPDWSLFIQPAYRPYLFAFDGGIGPDRDRISSLSVFAGLRIPLKP